jgi:RNA polymerase sigma-70 factor, ECF subfamily
MSAFHISISNVRRNIGPHVRVKCRNRRLRETESLNPNSPPIEPVPTSNSSSNEWDLVQQAIAGDRNVLDHLFTIHAARLHRTAFGILRNKEDAEDAVQNGLHNAFASLRSFQGESSFSTWLTRIVINSALMIGRKKTSRREASLDEILDNQPEWLQKRMVDTRPNPEESRAATEIHELVDVQIQQLPPGLRAAFRLYAVDDLSAADTMKALGIRGGAFKSRISRARLRLTNRLRRPLRPARSRFSVVTAS